MRYFVLLVDLVGRGISVSERRSYEALPRSRGLQFCWQSFPQAAVLTVWDDDYGEPLVVSDGDTVAAGIVRLDNRADLEEWTGSHGQRLADLELVRRLVVEHGTKFIHLVLGDFTFAVWNPTTRSLVAGCDAFAVKKLYYAEKNGLLTLASRAEAIALDNRYDAQYLAELVLGCNPSAGLNVYAGVRAVPDGTVLSSEDGRLCTVRYWTPAAFEPQASWAKSEGEIAERCRALLSESVRLRIDQQADTWSELSGGIDSSSVVSIAQWLVERGEIARGLAGTVTYVDRQGTIADERPYSDAVVSRWQVHNETIVDSPLWIDESGPPPYTDQPRMSYPFFPRDLRVRRTLRQARGRVLLTGVGGDELFTGFMYFFADWAARGRLWAAAREMARRAAIGRVSFWTLGYQNVVLPLLPAVVRKRLVRGQGIVPTWVTSSVIRRYGLDARTFLASAYEGRIGQKYHHGVLNALTGLGRLVEPGVIGDSVDLRHPFLYRPLVEFALRLPPELCIRPHQRKWLLREAMRGILPDAVRTRVGKGTPGERYAWSLAALRSLLDPLLEDPILADLGVIDAAKLRAAYDAAPQQPYTSDQLHASVYSTLALEAWLQVRSGRWPREGHRSIAAVS